MKRIIVHFLPALGLEPEIFEIDPRSGQKIGYGLSSNGEAPSYRVWIEKDTTVYPAPNVLKIETNI